MRYELISVRIDSHTEKINMQNVMLNQKQAREAFPMYSLAWWERKRWAGGGPKYRKLGNRIYYALSDLIEYFEKPTVRASTAEEASDEK